jgi:hypothetical protein
MPDPQTVDERLTQTRLRRCARESACRPREPRPHSKPGPVSASSQDNEERKILDTEAVFRGALTHPG